MELPSVRQTIDEVQERMIQAILREREAGRPSTILEAATGTGKTVCSAKYIRLGRERWGGRFIFIVDERKLAEQAEDKFQRWGLKVGVEMGDRKARDAMALMGGVDVVVATRQTLTGRRLRDWEPGWFTDGLIDECHGSAGSQTRTILDHFSGVTFWLGLSATPYRADGKPLVPDIFASIAYQYPLKDAIANGHLVPVRFVECGVGVDLRKIKTVTTSHGRDYHQGELEDRISASVDKLANAARMEMERIGLKKVLHFTPNVGTAQAFATAYNQMGVPARAVYGDCPDREDVFRQFEEGEIRVMTGCQMFNKGYDCLDRDTEVLTPFGWAGIGEIEAGDLVYSLNRSTGLIEATPAIRCVERGVHPGERMVEVKSQRINLRTTEGHEFHYKYWYGRKGRLSDGFLTKTAGQLVETRGSIRLPISAKSASAFPGVNLTDDEIRFVAWFMTDGGFCESDVVISQAKPETTERICDLLDRIGLDYRFRTRVQTGGYKPGSVIHEFSIPKGVMFGSKARNGWRKYWEYLDKNISPAMHCMTREQFLVFWSEALLGDGSVAEGKSGWLWCDRKTQADGYSHMAVIRGLAASHAEVTTKNGAKVFRVSVRDSQWLNIDQTSDLAAKFRFVEPQPGERVWCVENRNSTLVVRRGGKIAIIGNCPSVDGLIMGRPTKSHGLAWQQLGRGTRTSPATGKTHCWTIGFAWEADGDGPVSTLDLFMEDIPDPRTRQIAREIVRRKKDVDIQEVVEEAKKERELELEREKEEKQRIEARKLRIAAKKRDVSYRRREFDPLKVAVRGGLQAMPSQAEVNVNIPAPVASVLAGFGISDTRGLTEVQAKEAAQFWMDRAFRKMATPEQVSWLVSQKIPQERALAMTQAEARSEMGRRMQRFRGRG